MSSWVIWVVLAVILLGVEATTTAFVAGYFGVAAAITVVLALAGLPVLIQVLAFAALSVGGIALTRPTLKRMVGATPLLRTGVDAMRGRRGVVVSAIGALDDGQVKIGGEVWAARNYFDGEAIPLGTRVEVVEVKGVTALVLPAPAHDELPLGEGSHD